MRLLESKNAVITGCNRGIGKALVAMFAANGANVWACARKRNEEFEDDLRRTARQEGVWVKPVYFDIANEEEISAGVRKIGSEKKKIDILVNNAGISKPGMFQLTHLKGYRELFEINVFGTILITQLISRKMAAQKDGCIVTISSIAGLDGYAGLSAYGASKSAIKNFCKSIAAELGHYNIRSNVVAPGYTDTDMVSYKSAETRESLINASFLKRMGKPEEIAGAVMFLASDLSSFISGQVIRVDGGMS